MSLAWLRKQVGTVPLAALQGTTSANAIYAAPDGDDDLGIGSQERPYASATKALGQVTSTRKIVILAPGEYEETTGITWPAYSGVMLIGFGNRWQTVIRAAAGDQVLLVAPGAVDSTFELSIQNIQIDHDETGQDGLNLTNDDMTKKLNCYLGNVGFDGDSADKAIQVVHADTSNAVRIYWTGGNGGISGGIDLAAANNGDRFWVKGVELLGSIAAGSNIASSIRMYYCEIGYRSFTGGGASTLCRMVWCSSVTGTTFAAVDAADVTTNSSITGPTIVGT